MSVGGLITCFAFKPASTTILFMVSFEASSAAPSTALVTTCMGGCSRAKSTCNPLAETSRRTLLVGEVIWVAEVGPCGFRRLFSFFDDTLLCLSLL